MFKLARFFNKWDWLMLSILILFIGGEVLFDLYLPDKIQEIISLFAKGKPTAKEIWITALIALAFVLGAFFSAVLIAIFSAFIAQNYAKHVRKHLFSHINGLSADQINKLSVPSLITRNTSDIDAAALGFNNVIKTAISAPGVAIGGIIKVLLDKSSKGGVTYSSTMPFGIIIGSAIALLSIIIVSLVKFLLPRFKKSKLLTDEANLQVRENLSGIRVVRAFGMQKKHTGIYKDTIERTYRNNFALFAAFDSAFALVTTIVSVMTIVFYLVGSQMIPTNASSADITGYIAILTKYTILSTIIVFAFLRLAMLLFNIPSAMISTKRINEVFNMKTNIVNGKNAGEIKIETIEFKNVSFKFDPNADEVVKNISFKVNAGETIAIVGATGCGKTSVLSLIPRIYDVTSGQILINNVDIKEYDVNVVRNLIGFVPQKIFLFGDTVFNNIKNGFINEEINQEEIDERVTWASKIACADTFIDKLEDKYNYVISQNSTNLSGGQKQRLAIARAVSRKPQLLIFDDSFSALDMATDQKVRENIKNEMKCTKIIAAQRIGTIHNADKIIVIDKGAIVQIGKHQELMETCDIYKQIALSQLTGKELEHVK